jgi:nucleoside 2-deoxyribosyltransferase
MFREQPQAFIALPKGPAEPELRTVIRETLERHDVRPLFSDDTSLAALSNADLVIADITGANRNVMFEVGVALGMGKPLLLLSQERFTDLPFDLRAHQVAVYRPGDMESVRKFMELSLRDTLRERASLKA